MLHMADLKHVRAPRESHPDRLVAIACVAGAVVFVVLHLVQWWAAQ